jgi:glutamine synthetase
MLHIALEELDNDREFLKQGNVFTDEVIDSFIELKMQEVTAMRASPQPLEFDLYYSC